MNPEPGNPVPYPIFFPNSADKYSNNPVFSALSELTGITYPTADSFYDTRCN